tara:strand:+ start:38350 stop:39369 length:1020 start_codon:yes stop_codon:yes gene_type:complete
MIKYLFLLFIGCAQVTSLNLQKHQFGQIPTKIVWIQVAGLSEEHLALLKYSYPSTNIKTNFESALCVGKTWEYNLFKLRPSAQEGFLSQITGKKNIKGSCEDYSLKPIWSYLGSKNYKVGIFETKTTKEQSLLASKDCDNAKDYLDDLYFWKMTPSIPKSADLFHVGEDTQFKTDRVYYDRSCKTGECFSTFASNVEKTFTSFTRNNKNYLYIIRDFQFSNDLKKRKVKDARAQLEQLNKIIGDFAVLAEKSNDFMLLVTSSESYNVTFPRSGNEWESYEKKGKFLKNDKSQLISPLFVYGARSENFCGIYDQSEILGRIFSGAKQQGLEFTILNPFSE